MSLILSFIKKELLQFKRDKRMFAVIIIAPVFQLVFLGFAANLDVQNIKTVIWDQNRTVSSRDYISKYEKSGYFSTVKYVTSYDEITEMIDRGDALVGIIISPDFEKAIYNNRPAKVQLIFDGSDGNKTAIAAGYSISINQSYAGNIISSLLERTGRENLPYSKPPTFTAETRVWYNPDLITRNFMLPGIVGMLIMVVTINLTSLAIVKEKEIGTFEQLIVTPLKPYQMIVGKLVPFMLIGLVSVTIVITIMRFVFDIHVKGSLGLLYGAAFLFMLPTLGLGLFVSTVSKTQQQATMTSFFAVLMPMNFLSGFAFPIENMPMFVQYITYLIPLRYFITIVRGIILKGIGFNDLIPELSALLVFGIVILTLSSLRFRKKIE